MRRFTAVFTSSSSPPLPAVALQRLRVRACAACLAFLCLVNMEAAPALNGRLASPRVVCRSIEQFELSEVICVIADRSW